MYPSLANYNLGQIRPNTVCTKDFVTCLAALQAMQISALRSVKCLIECHAEKSIMHTLCSYATACCTKAQQEIPVSP